jgi:hypothetical protein
MPPQLVAIFAFYLPILNRHFRRGTRFDSHDFIIKLAKHHQPAYVEALEWYRVNVNARPFKPLHNALARLLRQPGLNVAYLGRGNSEDIFRDDVENALWERT